MIFDLHDSNDIETIRAYLKIQREQKKTVGFASGTFDVVHPHHVTFLKRCRRECDILIVGVDSDKLVRERKGPTRPLFYDSKRVEMIDALKPVALAFIINSVDDFGRAAQIVTPDIIFKNNDFHGREHEIVGKEHAGKIMIIPDVIELTSTSQILETAAKAVTPKTE
jgi:cytidyltransferase-like protein